LAVTGVANAVAGPAMAALFRCLHRGTPVPWWFEGGVDQAGFGCGPAVQRQPRALLVYIDKSTIYVRLNPN
jgi:hypothetical protein